MTASTRRRHTNLKLGCLNCKRKKIRCDENLPECGNCTRAAKEPCSYLGLTPAEINKLRVTHLLRNSQNKLLALGHRLPAATSAGVGGDKKSAAGALLPPASNLEFQFEMCPFDKPLPQIPYASLQFYHLSVSTFGREYELDSAQLLGRDAARLGALPGAVTHPAPLPAISYRKLRQPIREQYWQTLGFPELVFDMDATYPCMLLLIRSQLNLAQALMLSRWKQRKDVNLDKALADRLADIESRCCYNVSGILREVQETAAEFRNLEADLDETVTQRIIFCFLFWCCCAALSVLNFHRMTVLRAVSDRCEVYVRLLHLKSRPSLVQQVIDNLETTMQRNMTLIHIPSYEPAFMAELHEKYRLLAPLIDVHADAGLRHDYHAISAFLAEHIVPILFTLRNEQFITTYPPSVTYKALQRWWSIAPSEASPCNFLDHKKGFTKDLANTFYLYKRAIEKALDTVMPAARYLFSLGFEGIPHRPGRGLEDIRPDLGEYPEADKVVGEMLWRHNVYALRLTAFFSSRARLFAQHGIWTIGEDPKRNIFAPKQIKNALEIPIHRFSSLPIRPEHYARQIHSHYDSFIRDQSVYAVYTRSSEDSHPFQTLDLFDLSRPLNFLWNSCMCAEDYIPEVDSKMNMVGLLMLQSYYKERERILDRMAESSPAKLL